MRYGIFSDIHANLEALEAVLEAYQKENIDTYICVGDIVGYGANPDECVNRINSLCRTIVAGNHDWAVIELTPEEYFNRYALETVRWTKAHISVQSRDFLSGLGLLYEDTDLTLVHGTLDHPEDFDYLIDEYSAARNFLRFRTNILFVGHTHVAGIFIEDQLGEISYSNTLSLTLKDENRYIVNVGSVGQPRDFNPMAAYCVYDTDTGQVEIKRVAYDVETARRKIIEAGLPKILGDRLLQGR